MPIPLPNLDDRRWADLVDEGRAQIPRYAPDWTDHNPHDPGITLVDLFAWLAEMTNYRLNQVPSRHKRKFLELLGFAPVGPAPASVMLSFAPAGGAPALVLPAGVEFEGISPEGQVIPFRTLRELTLSAFSLAAIRVDAGGGPTVDRTADFVDGFPVPILGSDPRTGSTLYLGFDSPPTAIPISLGFRFQGPGNDQTERRRILAEAAAQAKSCRPVRPRFQCTTSPQPPDPLLPPHHSARMVWEAFTARGWVELVEVQPPATPAEGEVSDDTRSLTLDGIVELNLPADAASQSLGGVGPNLFYVRVRLATGAVDAVPVLIDLAVNAVFAEQAVPATERFVIRAGVAPGTSPAPGSTTRFNLATDANGVITTLSFSATDGPLARILNYTAAAATMAGEITFDLELIGIGTGLPDQIATLRDAPVANAETELYTLSGNQWRSWMSRPDFGASSRTDNHFVLDATTGVATFGSGERGRAPEAGSLIFARYRSTAAGSGNLGSGLISRLRMSPVNSLLLAGTPQATIEALSTMTTNRGSATGGAAAETLNHALGTAVEILHAHERLLDLTAETKSDTLDQIDRTRVRSLVAPQRAVNLIDIERISMSVPGTRVARARAWASLHPSYPCLEAPGFVTVVIIPEAPPGMPVPSEGLLSAVWRYLNRRRLVTTMIEVVGPQYVEITITATVQARAGASPARVSERVMNALNDFLDPLAGGPDSRGWPLGRSVFRTEILQLLDGVPGVDHVNTLAMTADTGPQQCGDIALCPTALVRSGPHRVEML